MLFANADTTSTNNIKDNVNDLTHLQTIKCAIQKKLKKAQISKSFSGYYCIQIL